MPGGRRGLRSGTGRALASAKAKQAWLRMEPLILHVSCRNINAADRVLRAKTRAGIKRGGIFHIAPNRVQIEIEGTKRVEALLKTNDRLIVNKEYIQTIVKLADTRFLENARDWKKLEKELEKKI